MSVKVAVGADHAGFPLKETIKKVLTDEGCEVLDLGTNSTDPVDYPDFALAVGKAILEGRAERGVILCGSGVGASVAANNVPGVRAGLCHDTFSAHQGVEDDDMNVLCMGARVIGSSLAVEVLRTWLHARYTHAERHERRKEKVCNIEKEFSSITAKK